MSNPLKIVARASPLSQAQVKEVFEGLNIPYEVTLVSTHGDLDRTQSLRELGATDFFTREVDEKVLSGECDLAIHSAKDLPEELPEGLKILAITAGRDSSDSLVMREGESLADVKRVATSSERREEAVKALKNEIEFCDIRGTIQERLQKLYDNEVDGVVIAEAALLRLNLSPNRLKLPGETTPLQGRLALVCRHETSLPEIEKLDARSKDTLYLGLRSPSHLYHHFPIITIKPLPFEPVKGATHLIFTSRTAVQMYKEHIQYEKILAVGKKTAQELLPHSSLIAELEQAEGIIALLKKENLENAHVVFPKSYHSREVISQWLREKNVRFTEIPLYTQEETSLNLPDTTPFKRIHFTSPSTVNAFMSLYGKMPEHKEIVSIGPITSLALEKVMGVKNENALYE